MHEQTFLETIAQLRDACLAYPETTEDFPWGERALKVRKKVFVFMFVHSEGMSMSLKLPLSGVQVLSHSYAQPTGYGLGKSGWVTLKFGLDLPVSVDQLLRWVDESYRAVAPKTLVRNLPALPPA